MPIPLITNRYYHIFNRGNNRENLFYRPENYEYFLQKYFYYCYPVFETYAYCLLSNHFHFLISVRTEHEQSEIVVKQHLPFKLPLTVSKQLSHLFNSYAQSINKQEERTGSLFQKNFKRKEIESKAYFRKVVVYIHQNPDKHGYSIPYQNYPYSSLPYYRSEETHSEFVNIEKVLSLFGGKENFIAAHDEFDSSSGEFLEME